MIEWDNVAGQDESPEHLDKLPAWAGPQDEENPVVKMKLRSSPALPSGCAQEADQRGA